MEINAPEVFSADIEVRFADLDAYGHVNNAVFFTYLETARTKLFLEKFIDLLDRGLLFLVVKAECEYLNPIRLSDRVVVSMQVVRIGRSSLDMEYAVHNGSDTTFATAKTAMVCFDHNLGRSVSLPESFRQALHP